MNKRIVEHITCKCGYKEQRELSTTKLGQFIDQKHKLKAAFTIAYVCPECGNKNKEKRKLVEEV